jgi:hypothetical protein
MIKPVRVVASRTFFEWMIIDSGPARFYSIEGILCGTDIFIYVYDSLINERIYTG